MFSFLRCYIIIVHWSIGWVETSLEYRMVKTSLSTFFHVYVASFKQNERLGEFEIFIKTSTGSSRFGKSV